VSTTSNVTVEALLVEMRILAGQFDVCYEKAHRAAEYPEAIRLRQLQIRLFGAIKDYRTGRVGDKAPDI
jgi:hypothetical protein